MAASFSSSFSFGFSELLFASRLVEAGRTEPWTFEVVALSNGEHRPFLIAAGLEQALSLLEGLELAETDLALLRAEPGPGKIDASLDEEALDRICALRFSGDVQAVPEGTVVFAGEPLLRLKAPAPEAVVVGAAVLAAMRAQTTIATRAARLKLAGGGKALYELGPSGLARDGSLVAARAAYLGGSSATTNPLAAGVWGMPAMPVVPLSLVVAMGESSGPLANCGVLLDGGAAARIDSFVATPVKPRAVLLDLSGSDGATRAMALRARMNAQGWRDVQLLGAGDLDEAKLEELGRPDVPLDGFAVASALLSGGEALSFEYELVEREHDGQRLAVPRRDGGVGRRAVWRRRESGRFKSDTVQPETKAPPSGAMPLLVPVMEKGKRQFRTPNLAEPRVLCEAQLSMLDATVTRRVDPANYPVTVVIDPPPAAASAPAAPAAARPSPAASPRPAATTRKGVLDQLDDSADFTVVSNVFAGVLASRLAPDAVDPMPTSEEESSSPPAATDSAPSAESSEPPEIDLEEIVDEPSASAFGELVPSQPPRAAQPVAAAAPPPAAKPAPSFTAMPAPSAPFAPSPAPAAPSPAPAPAADIPFNPLLAAAARLRSMQSGGPSSSQGSAAPASPPSIKLDAMPTEPRPLAPPSPPPASPAAPASAAKDGNDPLLAAAARLKSMRRVS